MDNISTKVEQRGVQGRLPVDPDLLAFEGNKLNSLNLRRSGPLGRSAGSFCTKAEMNYLASGAICPKSIVCLSTYLTTPVRSESSPSPASAVPPRRGPSQSATRKSALRCTRYPPRRRSSCAPGFQEERSRKCHSKSSWTFRRQPTTRNHTIWPLPPKISLCSRV